MPKKQKSDLKYSLIDFSILKFEMNEAPVKITKKTKNDWEFNSKFEIVEEKDELHIFIKIKSNILIKKEPFLICSFEVKTIFGIENISDYIKSENIIRFPDGFLRMCFGLTYSTSRGAVLTLMGTKVKNKNFILPLVDPGMFTEAFVEK